MEELSAAIVDLYLNVKIRSTEELSALHDSQLEAEKEKLAQTSPFTVIEYIRSSIEILLNLKAEEARFLAQATPSAPSSQAPSAPQTSRCSCGLPVESSSNSHYEQMIQKLEGDVRNHIRVEQQLKLHVESLTFKSEEAEKENERLSDSIARL